MQNRNHLGHDHFDNVRVTGRRCDSRGESLGLRKSLRYCRGGVRKMNGIRIGQPARNTRLIGSRMHMRAMGHAIFMQGAIDTSIEDCHVDGLLRPTNEILAETSGYAYEHGFKVPGYGEGVQIGADRLVPPDEIVSLSEDGIRMYPSSGGVDLTPSNRSTKA